MSVRQLLLQAVPMFGLDPLSLNSEFTIQLTAALPIRSFGLPISASLENLAAPIYIPLVPVESTLAPFSLLTVPPNRGSFHGTFENPARMNESIRSSARRVRGESAGRRLVFPVNCSLV